MRGKPRRYNGEVPTQLEQLLPLILAQADEMGYRLEIIGGLGVWEAMPPLRHIEAARRVEDSFRTTGDQRVFRDLYVRFPDDSLRRPDVAIYCREPDEEDEAVTLIPKAVVEVVSRGSERKDLELSPPFYLAQGVKDVVVLDPYTGIVWHHRTDRTVERHQSPVDLSLRCGCLVTV